MDLTIGVSGLKVCAEDDVLPTLNIRNVPEDLYRDLRLMAERDSCTVDEEALRLLVTAVAPGERGSILELRGLGKQIWNGIDAATYVDEERGAWK